MLLSKYLYIVKLTVSASQKKNVAEDYFQSLELFNSDKINAKTVLKPI